MGPGTFRSGVSTKPPMSPANPREGQGRRLEKLLASPIGARRKASVCCLKLGIPIMTKATERVRHVRQGASFAGGPVAPSKVLWMDRPTVCRPPPYTHAQSPHRTSRTITEERVDGVVAWAPKPALKARSWTKAGANGADVCEQAAFEGPEPNSGSNVRSNPGPERPFRSELLDDPRSWLPNAPTTHKSSQSCPPGTASITSQTQRLHDRAGVAWAKRAQGYAHLLNAGAAVRPPAWAFRIFAVWAPGFTSKSTSAVCSKTLRTWRAAGIHNGADASGGGVGCLLSWHSCPCRRSFQYADSRAEDTRAYGQFT